jgi:hypothetical protein
MKIIFAILFILQLALAMPAQGAHPITIKYDKKVVMEKWRIRIKSFLEKDIIPIIDVESSLKQ